MDILVGYVTKIIDALIGWINRIFHLGENVAYENEGAYKKYIMYAILLFVASKIFKIKLNFSK